MELVLIAFCRPAGLGHVASAVAPALAPAPVAAPVRHARGRHHLPAAKGAARSRAKSPARHRHDILCGFDCLAELGLVLDVGLDVCQSEAEGVLSGKQVKDNNNNICKKNYKNICNDNYNDDDDNNNKKKKQRQQEQPVAPWRQRPWDFPGGDRAVSLAWEDLERVPPPLAAGLGATITALDLSHNRLRDVEFLHAMPMLTSLVLDHNLLREDVDLPRLPRLRLLWLNHNQVRSVQPLVRRLQRQTPRLRQLSLIGNKAAPSPLTGAEPSECARYRLSMVWQLPMLEHLDERRVSEAERARSKHLQLRAIFNSCSRIPPSSQPLTPTALRRNTCV